MVFCWHADNDPKLNPGFVIFLGIRTSIAKKPYIFVIIQIGRGSGPPLWIHPCCCLEIKSKEVSQKVSVTDQSFLHLTQHSEMIHNHAKFNQAISNGITEIKIPKFCLYLF